jgi:hypothetical protein
MDDAPDRELDHLPDVMFFAAAAGTCFVVALFCVMTPFFLESDVLSTLLLVGFFAFAYGTYFFGSRSYRAEQRVQRSYIGAMDELDALRVEGRRQ